MPQHQACHQLLLPNLYQPYPAEHQFLPVEALEANNVYHTQPESPEVSTHCRPFCYPQRSSPIRPIPRHSEIATIRKAFREQLLLQQQQPKPPKRSSPKHPKFPRHPQRRLHSSPWKPPPAASSWTHHFRPQHGRRIHHHVTKQDVRATRYHTTSPRKKHYGYQPLPTPPPPAAALREPPPSQASHRQNVVLAASPPSPPPLQRRARVVAVPRHSPALLLGIQPPPPFERPSVRVVPLQTPVMEMKPTRPTRRPSEPTDDPHRIPGVISVPVSFSDDSEHTNTPRDEYDDDSLGMKSLQDEWDEADRCAMETTEPEDCRPEPHHRRTPPDSPHTDDLLAYEGSPYDPPVRMGTGGLCAPLGWEFSPSPPPLTPHRDAFRHHHGPHHLHRHDDGWPSDEEI